ncbi:MAG: O-antigen ligase family protein [Pirellulales bacterium]
MDGIPLPTEKSDADQPNTWLTHACDFALMGVIFVAPYFMGGRHPLGQLVFVLFVVLFAVTWLVQKTLAGDRRWRSSAAQWIVLAGITVLVVQLTPLPTATVNWLAPRSAETMPLWSADADSPVRLGTWQTVSVTPVATRAGLAMFLAYSLLFLISLQRLRRTSDVERLLRWIAAATVVMGLVAIVQYLASNGKFLGIYQHPFRTANNVQASFINRNHFAHMMALGLGPILASILLAMRRHQKRPAPSFGQAGPRSESMPLEVIALTIGLAVVLFAGYMSLSRGGALALTTSLVAACLGCYAGGLVRNQWYLVSAVGIASVVGVSLYIHGYERVSRRLDDFSSMSLEELDQGQGRRGLWSANIAAARDRPWLGFGVGSHREVYKLFLPKSYSREYTHAESGYLQVLSESGVAGGVLLAMGIGLCVFWCARAFFAAESETHVACAIAVISGLAASLVHSLVDFVWYLPACLSWTLLLAAVACFLCRRTASSEGNSDAVCLASPVWAAITLLVCVVGVWMVANRVRPALASNHWDRYLRNSQMLGELETELESATAATAANRPDPEKTREYLISQMQHELERYVAIDPTYPRAHVRLAMAYLRGFQQHQKTAENRMDLAQIRDAALASKFETREALDEWMSRATGPHHQMLDKALRHARWGLGLSPLQGEGYLMLAELSFLQPSDGSFKSAYVDQAIRVRPHDGHVLLVAGREAMLAGNLEAAVELWKRSYHAGEGHQDSIVQMLAGRVPVAMFLEIFQPALSQWYPLFSRYSQLDRLDDLRAICDYFIGRADKQPPGDVIPSQSRMWLEFHNAYLRMANVEMAERCIREACRSDPQHVGYRTTLAAVRLMRGEYEEAEKDLHWCLQRRPGNRKLTQLLEKAVRGRLSVAGSAGQTPARN